MIRYSSMREELEKVALIGPATSLGLLGTPDIAGYALGRKAGRKGEKRSIPAVAKTLLVPGGIGHELGYQKGLSEKKAGMDKDEFIRRYLPKGMKDPSAFQKHLGYLSREEFINKYLKEPVIEQVTGRKK